LFLAVLGQQGLAHPGHARRSSSGEEVVSKRIRRHEGSPPAWLLSSISPRGVCRWYDPRYIINELNTNSAIAQPNHDDVLDLTTSGETYTIKGYAYSGGGRRVNRVEVSLDEGISWTLAEIH